MSANELRQVRRLVLRELSISERSRNDDKYLTFKIIQRCLGQRGDRLQLSPDDFENIPAFETIKRIRAQIQNKEKRFLPTSAEVRNLRGIKEQEYRQYFIAGEGRLFV